MSSVTTCVLEYFPHGLAAVAAVSEAGAIQHGLTRLGFDRAVSHDHAAHLASHLARRGTFDTDGCRHSAKVAWRALAMLQVEIENDMAAGQKKEE